MTIKKMDQDTKIGQLKIQKKQTKSQLDDSLFQINSERQKHFKTIAA